MENYPKLNIKEWALEDRPREKMITKGSRALTDAELIAILIASGNSKESAVELAKRILLEVKNNLNELGKLNLNNFMNFKGIGHAKALTIMAALELGRRRNQAEALQLEKITCSSDVANFLRPIMGDLAHEEFWVCFLNRNNKIIDHKRLSQGGISGTVIDVRLIMKTAIEMTATSLIFAHNHPSGNLEPSDADRKITRQIKEAGIFLEIPLLDHLIITQTGYYSFSDEGLL